jgi:hypothetical protein
MKQDAITQFYVEMLEHVGKRYLDPNTVPPSPVDTKPIKLSEVAGRYAEWHRFTFQGRDIPGGNDIAEQLMKLPEIKKYVRVGSHKGRLGGEYLDEHLLHEIHEIWEPVVKVDVAVKPPGGVEDGKATGNDVKADGKTIGTAEPAAARVADADRGDKHVEGFATVSLQLAHTYVGKMGMGVSLAPNAKILEPESPRSEPPGEEHPDVSLNDRPAAAPDDIPVGVIDTPTHIVEVRGDLEAPELYPDESDELACSFPEFNPPERNEALLRTLHKDAQKEMISRMPEAEVSRLKLTKSRPSVPMSRVVIVEDDPTSEDNILQDDGFIKLGEGDPMGDDLADDIPAVGRSHPKVVKSSVRRR